LNIFWLCPQNLFVGCPVRTQSPLTSLENTCFDIGINEELFEDNELIRVHFRVIEFRWIAQNIRKNFHSQFMIEVMIYCIESHIVWGVKRFLDHPYVKYFLKIRKRSVSEYLPQRLEIFKGKPNSIRISCTYSIVFGCHDLIQKVENGYNEFFILLIPYKIL